MSQPTSADRQDSSLVDEAADLGIYRSIGRHHDLGMRPDFGSFRYHISQDILLLYTCLHQPFSVLAAITYVFDLEDPPERNI